MADRDAATRDGIMAAVNAGTDLAMEAIGAAGYSYLGPDQAQNIATLVVNAIGTMLDDPSADMADVMAGNFTAETISDWREELGDAIVDEALRRSQSSEGNDG